MLAAQPEIGTTHISSRSHLNLTFNLYECGSAVLPAGSALAYPPEDAYALIYIANGQYSLSFDGFSNKAGEARGFFTFPESHYTLINTGEEPLHLTWVQFSGYLIDNYLNRANISRSRPLFLDPQNTVGTGMQYLWEASLHMPNRYCRMVARLYDIFSYLLDANPTKNSSGYVDSADFFAVKAAEFIERNYTRDVSVPQIASALGISRKHLYAVFNNILKISPKQYLIYYRIEKACDG